MDSLFLDLPPRTAKPRSSGLTATIDTGVPHRAFSDAVHTAAGYIDLVKFGWGTALVTPDVDFKLETLRRMEIGYYFGGTLFEKFVAQDRFESFITLCRLCECRYVEISDGTIELSGADKARYIARCAEEFTVLSEVGYKDVDRASHQTAAELVRAVHNDLSAGASFIVTEARESGRSGICGPDGKPRVDMINAIVDSGVAPEQFIFEAPTKELQTHFVKLFGANVNLGNIALGEVIAVETLRVGLRSDTLLHFEQVSSRA